MCFTEYFIFSMLACLGVLFAVAVLPVQTLVLLGSIIIPAGFAVIGAAIYRYVNRRRMLNEIKARLEDQEAKIHALKDRRDDLASIRIIGRSIGVQEAAEGFVQRCYQIDAAREEIASSRLVSIDHTLRTALSLMRTAAPYAEQLSDDARSEIEISLQGGTALMDATLRKITLGIEKEVTSSAQALSMQLHRMVKVPS